MQVLLSSIGFRGDVWSTLALALELQVMGATHNRVRRPISKSGSSRMEWNVPRSGRP